MLTAKQNLAHIADVITEEEAERILDSLGVNSPDGDSGKMKRSYTLLQAAARLLYDVGGAECVQFGERVDAVLKDLMALSARKSFRDSLAETLRSFANSVIEMAKRNAP